MRGENSYGTVGLYLLASVVAACVTFIIKGDSLMFVSNGIGLQIKSSKEDIETAIDKAIVILANKMDTNFLRLESRIDVLEKKIDQVEVTLTGVIRRVDNLERDLLQIARINYRNLSAIDLIVGKARLDVEESEIDNHLSMNFVKNQSGGQDRPLPIQSGLYGVCCIRGMYVCSTTSILFHYLVTNKCTGETDGGDEL
jgi:hypothetical protein